ncbi:hypothetical protein [uncultured Brevundimonas sp.]|uniref:hypothetical protein n=1 Tax=uncultured Brevundimonas sp. TaxID=213418 RepID=UPI00260EDA5F|nr:hypothetical protein [uncultured Brevundimonas sp.]
MSRATGPTRAAQQRSIEALKAAGCEIARVVVRAGGDVVILTTADAEAQEVQAGSALDQWREKRHGPRAAQGT